MHHGLLLNMGTRLAANGMSRLLVYEETVMVKNFKRCILLVVMLVGMAFFFPGGASSQTMYIPVTIDYPLLRSLVIYSSFPCTDQTAQVLFLNNGCTSIILSDPRYRAEQSHVRGDFRLRVKAGSQSQTGCADPVEWDGYLTVLQNPVINKGDWGLSFKTVEYRLLDMDHKPASVPEAIRELIDVWAYDYINHISVKLLPPFEQFKVLFSEVFPPKLHSSAVKMIAGMTVESPVCESDALRIYLRFTTDEIIDKNKELQKFRESPLPREDATELWKTWDTFLVYLIHMLTPETLTKDEKQILLDTLLETRYSFTTALSEGMITREFVGEEFVAAWQELAPVFRKHFGGSPSQDIMSYLAFFTVTDALAALNELIVDLGIEINEDTLRLMASFLSKGKKVPLEYQSTVDETLKGVLDLERPIQHPLPPPNPLSYDMRRTVGTIIAVLFPSSAWADENEEITTAGDRDQWVYSRENIDPYLERVRALLEQVSASTIENGKIPDDYHDLYRLIVFSTTWQESCFRQFKKKQGAVNYLRSYNNTSVGIMQINEIVWRGIYDPEKLRWDIQYNINAGCQILETYLCRYALKRIEKLQLESKIDNDTMARTVYAMYNGGPRDFYKFLKRSRTGKYYQSDQLFWDKYRWVKNGEWSNIRICLIGG